MAKMQIDIGEETAKRLREFTLAKTGKFRGNSIVVEEAILEYLDRKEQKAVDQTA